MDVCGLAVHQVTYRDIWVRRVIIIDSVMIPVMFLVMIPVTVLVLTPVMDLVILIMISVILVMSFPL